MTLKHVPDRPGVTARIFGDIASANIVVADITQNVVDDNNGHISFTVEHGHMRDIEPVVDRLCRDLGGGSLAVYHSELAKVSVVGVGRCVHTAVAQKMFRALAEAGINIQNITTGEIKISCIINKGDAARALQLVQHAFELGKAAQKWASTAARAIAHHVSTETR